MTVKAILERRRKRKSGGNVALNMISMTDVFTVLVFFLMVNTGAGQVLEPTSGLRLPDSVSKRRPEPFVVVSIHDNRVLVGDRVVASVAEVLSNTTDVVPVLRDALTSARIERAGDSIKDGLQRPVTIMGDRSLPYTVLKRVMASCQAASLNEIELAINQTTVRKSPSI